MTQGSAALHPGLSNHARSGLAYKQRNDARPAQVNVQEKLTGNERLGLNVRSSAEIAELGSGLGKAALYDLK